MPFRCIINCGRKISERSGKVMEKNKSLSASHIKTHAVITILVSAFLIIFMVAAVLIYTGMSGDTVDSNASAVTLASARGTTYAVGNFFQSRTVAMNSYAVLFRDAEDMTEEEILHRLDECLSCGMFESAALINKDGIALRDTGETKNLSHRAYAQQAFSGEGVIFLNTNSEFDTANYDVYSVPVYNHENEIIAVLAASSKPFSIEDIEYVDIAGEKNCYYIVNEGGEVLVASHDSTVGIKDGDDIRTAIEDNKTVEYYLNIRDAKQSVITDVNGQRCVVSCVSIPGQNWTLVAVAPMTLLSSYIGGMYTLAIVLVACAIVVIAVIVTVLAVKMFGMSRRFSGFIAEKNKNFYCDDITGYSSWNSFKERYPEFMRNTGTSYALISLDIDKFKAINDSLGYDGGNDVLKQVADVINRNLKEGDMFARSSGDLFYILLTYENVSDVRNTVINIINDVDYLDKGIKMYVCMGIYLVIDHNIKVEAAADRADLARRSIKDQKESNFAFFDNAMIQRIRNEKSIEDIMEDALEKREFQVYLQPKYSLKNPEQMVGAEALVRWFHDGALITPNKFIPVFEKNGFIVQLDYYMFEEVCKLQKRWFSMGCEPKIVSVNMSRLHLRSKHFVEDLVAMCSKYEIDTKYFEIEITETAAYENLDILSAVFEKIKSVGFHVSIDDFGTGYSSLNMLKDLKVDVLKIDRSFLTEDADENENASRIIACVVTLASSLKIATICEGIETKEQADLLTKLGCNMAQGYFFARPMAAIDYEKLAYGEIA